jgi:hypothetical protein
MKTVFAYSLSLVLLVTFVMPAPAQAAYGLNDLLTPQNLVPCGKSPSTTDTSAGHKAAEHECTFKDFITLIKNVMTALIILSMPIATIAFIAIGYMYLTAQGDVGKRTRAKAIAKNVIVGFIFVIAAFGLVGFIAGAILRPEFNLFWDK